MKNIFQNRNASRHTTLLFLLCMLSALVLIGCATATTPIDASSGQAATTQRQGTNLGAAVPRMNKPATASRETTDHAAMGDMKGMDHTAIGGTAGVYHSTMPSEKKSPEAHAHGHQLKKSAQADHAAHGGHGPTAAGKPGNAASVSRTINVKASDTMRFEPSAIKVKAGETIRFVVTNVGKLPHELMVGTTEEQKEHEKMMQQMPGMEHEEANGVTVDPGQTKTLVWQFGSAQDIELACHVPGHYPAGMVSKVSVAR